MYERFYSKIKKENKTKKQQQNKKNIAQLYITNEKEK